MNQPGNRQLESVCRGAPFNIPVTTLKHSRCRSPTGQGRLPMIFIAEYNRSSPRWRVYHSRMLAYCVVAITFTALALEKRLQPALYLGVNRMHWRTRILSGFGCPALQQPAPLYSRLGLLALTGFTPACSLPVPIQLQSQPGVVLLITSPA